MRSPPCNSISHNLLSIEMTMHSSTLTSRILPLLGMVVVGLLFTALAFLLYKLLLSKRCMGEDQTATPESPDETTMAFSGIEDKVLERIPILAYSGQQQGRFRSEQSECVVCLNELEEGAMVRLLPICRHAFHLRCINQWFYTHSNCPLCRTPVISPSQADHQDETSADVAVVQKITSGWLQPWNSFRFPTQRRPILLAALKRSLSMDSSYVTVEIKCEVHSSPSSSKRAGFWRNHSYKRKSFKIMNSLSRLRPENEVVADETLPL